MDNWEEVFTGTLRMLKIIIMTKCAAYKLPTVLNVLVLLALREVNHPIWRLYKHQCSLFNEEICERSLSPLAQVVNIDTQRHDLKHMSNTYRLLRHSTVLMQTMNRMLGRVRTTWEGIRLDDADIGLTVVHLKGVIRKLVNNQFRHYMGKPEDWVNATTAQSTMDTHLAPKFFKDRTIDELKKILESVKTRIVDCEFSNTFEVHGDQIDRTGDEREEEATDLDGPPPDVPLDLGDEIADTIYEGEDKESDVPPLSQESDEDRLEDTKKRPLVGKVRIPGVLRASKPRTGAGPSIEGHRSLAQFLRPAISSAAIPIDEVKSLVESLSQEVKAVAPIPRPTRPHRTAAPISGQFVPIAQNIEIMDMGNLVPMSPPAKSRRRAKKPKVVSSRPP